MKYLLIFLLFSSYISAQEICNNGLDDDNDGLVDLNDNIDCACNDISAVNLETTIYRTHLLKNTIACQLNFLRLSIQMLSGKTEFTVSTTGKLEHGPHRIISSMHLERFGQIYQHHCLMDRLLQGFSF